MKNILIPTDFRVESLSCLGRVLARFTNERLNILFTHVFLMSDSITELMLLSRRRKEYDYISDAFWQSCKQWELTHRTQINSIQVECFYGNTVAIFKNYLEARRIDRIVYPDNYQFRKLCSASFDPEKLIKKCGREVVMLTNYVPENRNSHPVSIKNVPLHVSLN